MAVVLKSETPPMRIDQSGVLRVGRSRVLVELVVAAFRDGATPEAIVQRYPTAELSDVYGVIAYYLRHPEDMDSYLAECAGQADEVRRGIEKRQGDLAEIRRRLLAQRRS